MSEVATRAIDLSRAQTVMFGPISRRRSICQIVGRSPTLLFNSPRHSLTLISRDAEIELAHVKAQRIGNPSVAGKSSSYNINPRPCPRPSSSNTCLRPFTPNSRETRSQLQVRRSERHGISAASMPRLLPSSHLPLHIPPHSTSSPSPRQQ